MFGSQMHVFLTFALFYKFSKSIGTIVCQVLISTCLISSLMQVAWRLSDGGASRWEGEGCTSFGRANESGNSAYFIVIVCLHAVCRSRLPTGHERAWKGWGLSSTSQVVYHTWTWSCHVATLSCRNISRRNPSTYGTWWCEDLSKIIVSISLPNSTSCQRESFPSWVDLAVLVWGKRSIASLQARDRGAHEMAESLKGSPTVPINGGGNELTWPPVCKYVSSTVQSC